MTTGSMSHIPPPTFSANSMNMHNAMNSAMSHMGGFNGMNAYTHQTYASSQNASSLGGDMATNEYKDPSSHWPKFQPTGI